MGNENEAVERTIANFDFEDAAIILRFIAPLKYDKKNLTEDILREEARRILQEVSSSEWAFRECYGKFDLVAESIPPTSEALGEHLKLRLVVAEGDSENTL